MRSHLLAITCLASIVILVASIFTGFQDIKYEKHDMVSPYDWHPVEQAIGKNGTMLAGDVYMISLPRNDLNVTLGGIRLKPAFALDSWVAFTSMGNESMMMGDLVLTDEEMGRVQKKIHHNGIEISAIHNTLIGEFPKTYDLHISGRGDPITMAGTIHDALMLTGTPYDMISDTSIDTSLDHMQLDRIIGYVGTWDDGIYHYDIPRAEKIMERGMEIPPNMDVSTSIKFEPLGAGKAAITGDYILLENEVNPVISALNDNGIDVVALHSHMLNEEPRMFFLHFWGTGDTVKLAQGLHDALDKTNSGR